MLPRKGLGPSCLWPRRALRCSSRLAPLSPAAWIFPSPRARKRSMGRWRNRGGYGVRWASLRVGQRGPRSDRHCTGAPRLGRCSPIVCSHRGGQAAAPPTPGRGSPPARPSQPWPRLPRARRPPARRLHHALPWRHLCAAPLIGFLDHGSVRSIGTPLTAALVRDHNSLRIQDSPPCIGPSCSLAR